MRMVKDSHGFPVLMAELPTPKSGEGTTPAQDRQRPSTDEAARRRDAVREAAREFEKLTPQDMRERLKGATSRPLAMDEIAAFTADVRAAQLDDMVDVLDQVTRGRLRGRRTVKLTAPRGYVKKTLNDMTDDELVELAARLRARGWDDDMVAHGLGRRLSAKRLDTLAARL